MAEARGAVRPVETNAAYTGGSRAQAAGLPPGRPARGGGAGRSAAHARAAFALQPADDWRMFLLERGRELKSGGRRATIPLAKMALVRESLQRVQSLGPLPAI
jgi:hypothetical protein